MTKVELSMGDNVVHDITVAVEQPRAPEYAPPLPIGLVELGQVIMSSMWFTGPVPPNQPGNSPGDMWLGSDGSIWTWDGDSWENTGINISSSDTPEEVLAKLITVDGAGSDLDADMLDGFHAIHFGTQADMDAAEARLDAVESKNIAQDSGIAANTSKNTEQDGRLTAIESVNTAQDSAIAGKEPAIATGNPAYFWAGDKTWKPVPAAGIPEAPNDTNAYGRKALNWVDVPEEAPSDGLGYMRKNGAWVPSTGGAATSDTPPAPPLQNGQLWWESDTGDTWIYYVDPGGAPGQWVQINNAGDAVAWTDDAAPGSPRDGLLWYRSNRGSLYVYLDDGNSSQWVEIVGPPGPQGAPGPIGSGGNYSTVVWGQGQNLPPGVPIPKVTCLDQVDTDPDGAWSVANQRFQPKRGGFYNISVKATIDHVDQNCRMVVFLYKNGVEYAMMGRGTSGSNDGNPQGFGGSIGVLMNGTTDYLEMYVFHNNPSSVPLTTGARYTAFTAAYVSVGPTANQRNHIVNPCGQVNQEVGHNIGVGNALYCADQWIHSFAGGGVTTAFTNNALAMPSPKGTRTSIQTYVTTAQASLVAGAWWGLYQILEGQNIADFHWGYANAVPALLRFSIYASKAGSYAICLRNTPQSHNFNALYTAVVGWNEIVIPIPAPPTGTWNVDASGAANLWFTFAAGTTQQGNAGWSTTNMVGLPGMTNGLDAVNNSFHIADVGLYVDPQGTGVPPTFELPNYADELARCKRYWQRTFTMFSGNVTSGSAYYGAAELQVEPRGSATLSGTPSGQAGFPATIGTLSGSSNNTMYESRVANSTGAGVFDSVITVNARM